jgi:hypothetical protein
MTSVRRTQHGEPVSDQVRSRPTGRSRTHNGDRSRDVFTRKTAGTSGVHVLFAIAPPSFIRPRITLHLCEIQRAGAFYDTADCLAISPSLTSAKVQPTPRTFPARLLSTNGFEGYA